MNSDRLTASWALLVGAIVLIYWFWSLDPLRKKALLHQDAQDVGPQTGEGGGTLAPSDQPGSGTPLSQLENFANVEGLKITSTTGGHHNPGSLHYQGRAIDVSVNGLSPQRIQQVMQDAINSGFKAIKELYTGNGPYGQSSGPHLHISLPPPGSHKVSYQDQETVLDQSTGSLLL